MVEALAHKRHAIGFDVSPIAAFVSDAKTTVLTESEIEEISIWAEFVLTKTIKRHRPVRTFYDDEGYLNNLPSRTKASVEIILDEVDLLETEQQRRFAKCVVLRTAQWAIDCRTKTPRAKDFRDKFSQTLKVFITGIRDLSHAVSKYSDDNFRPQCICINNSSELINQCDEFKSLPAKPKLVITSPPYVGVHMLYHQWQVNGRKRTRAPFWIIDSLDGQGSSFYTFGYYQSHAKKTYFEIAEKVFTSIYSAIDDDALVVQLVGFSNPRKFLPKYLSMMNEAGYEEVSLISDKLNRIRRIWRHVPNRKWYIRTNTEATSSKEVLLVHRKKCIK